MEHASFIRALDALTISDKRERALLKRILASADAERRAREPRVSRKACLLLAAAILLLLAACAAVYISSAAAAKANAEAALAQSDAAKRQQAEELAAELVDGTAPYVAMDDAVTVGGVTLRLRGIELDDNGDGTTEMLLEFDTACDSGEIAVLRDASDEDGSAGARCLIGMDARAFTLKVGDKQYQPYRQPDWEGQAQPAVFHGTYAMWCMQFTGVDASIAAGAEMLLSGQLNRYDADGVLLEPIGSFSIRFSYQYGEQERQARIDAMAEEVQQSTEADAQERLETLDTLPTAATPLNIHAGDVTVLDAARSEDGLLLGIRYEWPEDERRKFTLQLLDFYMDGYQIWPLERDVKVGDTSVTWLWELPLYASMDEMPEKSVLYLARPEAWMTDLGDGVRYSRPDPSELGGRVRELHVEAVETAFRCNWRTGAVSRVPDSELAACLAQQRALVADGRNAHRLYDAGAQQTINGVTVKIASVYLSPAGQWRILYQATGLLCELMTWETAPHITIDADRAALPFWRDYTVDVAEFASNYDLKTPRGTSGDWTAVTKKRVDMLPEVIPFVIEWELYDLNADGERVLVGTFRLDVPVDRDVYTVLEPVDPGIWQPGLNDGPYPRPNAPNWREME